MPFCASCGSPVEGRFCAKCGAAMGAAPAAGGPAPAYNPPPPAAATASGLTDNLAGALCYVLGFITGILFLVMEPYSKKPFVRFHAFQSIIFCLAWIVLWIALGIVFSIIGLALHMWFIFLPLRMILGLAGLVLWLFCMYKANSGEWFQLPIIGPIALKQSGAQQS